MHILQQCPNAVADTENFPADQLITRQQALGVVAQVNDNTIASYLFLGATDQLAHPIKVFFNGLRALGLTHFLHDNLLGGLCGDAAKFDVLDLFPVHVRSEEHTSELQSRGHLVCRLLLDKKKKTEHTADW